MEQSSLDSSKADQYKPTWSVFAYVPGVLRRTLTTLFLQIYKLMLPRASLAHHRTLVRIPTTIMVEINFSTQVVVMAEISSMVVVEVATTKLATPICSVRFSINMDMKLISITTDMMMIMFPLNLWITPNKSQSQSSPNPNQYPNQNPNSYLN